MTINKAEIKVIAYLFFVGIIVFFIHFMLLRAFPETLYAPGILFSHLFMFILSVVTIVILNYIFKKVKPSLLGYTFLGSSLFKMAISILYLLPVLRCDCDYKKIYVVQFFMIYFIYLAMEVIYLGQQLKTKKN